MGSSMDLPLKSSYSRLRAHGPKIIHHLALVPSGRFIHLALVDSNFFLVSSSLPPHSPVRSNFDDALPTLPTACAKSLPYLCVVSMEHGSFQDQSQATFSLTDEDHTLANSLRFTLNQEVTDEGVYCSPRITFCGYSIPHPSDARVNIRVQTTGDPAREVLKDSCQDLMLICQHVRSTFDQAVAEFKSKKGLESLNIKQ